MSTRQRKVPIKCAQSILQDYSFQLQHVIVPLLRDLRNYATTQDTQHVISTETPIQRVQKHTLTAMSNYSMESVKQRVLGLVATFPSTVWNALDTLLQCTALSATIDKSDDTLYRNLWRSICEFTLQHPRVLLDLDVQWTACFQWMDSIYNQFLLRMMTIKNPDTFPITNTACEIRKQLLQSMSSMFAVAVYATYCETAKDENVTQFVSDCQARLPQFEAFVTNLVALSKHTSRFDCERTTPPCYFTDLFHYMRQHMPSTAHLLQAPHTIDAAYDTVRNLLVRFPAKYLCF